MGSLRSKPVPIIVIMLFFFLINQTSVVKVNGPATSIISSAAENSNNSTTQDNNTTMITYVTIDKKNITLPSARSLLNQPQPYEEYDIFKLSPNLSNSSNTIVTAYFRVSSKHSTDQYDNWMRNFLSIQDHMVIYTQPELLPQIKEMRSHALDRTVIILMNMNAIPIGNLYPPEFWNDQLERDYEKARHSSYELFWIWLNKPWIVMDAIRHNFYNSDLYMYADIGCFRSGSYNHKTVIQHREMVPKNEMLCQYFRLDPPKPPNIKFFDDKRKYEPHFYQAGSQLAAYAETWTTFYNMFLDMIDTFLQHNMLLVDDQCILQSVCLTHPQVCAYVLAYEVYPRDKRYHVLRYVLHHGGKYNYWRLPNTTSA